MNKHKSPQHQWNKKSNYKESSPITAIRTHHVDLSAENTEKHLEAPSKEHSLLTPDSFKSPHPAQRHTRQQPHHKRSSSHNLVPSSDKCQPQSLISAQTATPAVNILDLLAKNDTSGSLSSSEVNCPKPAPISSPAVRPPKLSRHASLPSFETPVKERFPAPSVTMKSPFKPQYNRSTPNLQRHTSPKKQRERACSSPPKADTLSSSPPPSADRWAGVSSPAATSLPIPSFSEQPCTKTSTQDSSASDSQPQVSPSLFSPSPHFNSIPSAYAPQLPLYTQQPNQFHPLPTPPTSSHLDLLSQQIKQMLTTNS